MASQGDFTADYFLKSMKEKVLGPGVPVEGSYFTALDSNIHRYMYARSKLPDLDELLPIWKPFAKKCPLTAEMLKSDGNNAFRLCQFEKAQELFTLSAAYAVPGHMDGSGKNTLALAIANRSGALFYLKKYKECLIDIKNALHIGYPEDLKYKLYDRQGKSYQALKAYRAAETAFQQAVTLLGEATLEEVRKKSTLTQIDKNIAICVRNKATNMEVNLNLKKKLPELADKPNPTYPSLSSACEVKYRPGKGRCVIAARDIKPGEVLLVEKPFSVVPIPHEEYKDCCHNCFYPCLTLLPCLKCTKARYCSIECRDESWEAFHRYECGVPLCDLIGEGTHHYLALRTVIVAGLNLIHESLKKRSRRPNKEEVCPKFLSSDYHPVYELQSSSRSVSMDLYFEAAFHCYYLTKLLEKMGFFDSVENEEKEGARIAVGDSLISHYVSRCLTILHYLPGGPLGSKQQVDVAISLASTHSLFNHSCGVQTCASFYGSNVVLHSLKTFKKGEEVHVNFCSTFATVCKDGRQKVLDTISLKCSCEPCLGNWPRWRELGCQPTYRCPLCKAPLYGAETQYFKCLSCKTDLNVNGLVAIIHAAKNMLNHALSKVNSTLTPALLVESQYHLDVVLEYLAKIDEVVVQPWRESLHCKLLMRQALWMKGSYVNVNSNA